MALKYVGAVGPLAHNNSTNSRLVTATELLRANKNLKIGKDDGLQTTVFRKPAGSAYASTTLFQTSADADMLELPVPMAPPAMPQLGYVTHEHFEQVIPLHGAPNSQSRYGFEYYVVTNSAGRISICTPPDRELWTGDGVEVPGLPGVWRVTLFEPRYIH